MAAYYVLGIVFVVFALGLTALGLTREGFPPSRSSGRALAGTAAVLALVTLIVLLATTEREHPREEAKAKAAERKAEEGKVAAGGAPAEKGGASSKNGGQVEVTEKEYSIALARGSLSAGKNVLEVANTGKIQHDLAVEGGGVEEKTPLIDAGKRASLEVDLKAGQYKLYCTVPGHEELGMETEVTVR